VKFCRDILPDRSHPSDSWGEHSTRCFGDEGCAAGCAVQ